MNGVTFDDYFQLEYVVTATDTNNYYVTNWTILKEFYEGIN
jgi:hypothetical protein